jgi:hypothetical protein
MANSESSILPASRVRHTEVAWEGVVEPGCYVEVGSGDLYRIPHEALIRGSSPIIRKESLGASRLVQLSKDPFITTVEARMLSAENNVKPNF